MKKVVTILALLALVTSASATVRVFVTKSSDPYGLENNANYMIPTVSTAYVNGVDENGYDYWADYDGTIPGPIRPGGYPPADAPSGTPDVPIVIPPGDFAYIWLQFQGEPAGVKINGLQISIHVNGVPYDPNDPNSYPPLATTYYLCNNMNNLLLEKRWDGTATPPGYPEWHRNPQTMVGVTAYGIKNTAAGRAHGLWSGGTARIALLGAVEYPAGKAFGDVYEILISLINYGSGEPPGVAAGYFVPEPASLLLMGLVGLLIRRR